MIASKELRALKSSHSQQFSVSAKKLADFLQSVEAEETMLMQRLRDAEGRNVLDKINDSTQLAKPDEIQVADVAKTISDGLPEEYSTEEAEDMLEVYEEF